MKKFAVVISILGLLYLAINQTTIKDYRPSKIILTNEPDYPHAIGWKKM